MTRAGVVAAAVCCAGAALGQAPGAAAERECLFVPGTVIPRLAMGVCRPDADAAFREATDLELWESPSAAAVGEPAAVRPLFTPLYVYEERPGAGTTWYRLGDAYAANGKTTRGGPLGWVDGRRLHLLESRYGHAFENVERTKPVHLYASKQAAYAALEAQEDKAVAEGFDKDVLVAERREEGGRWDPLSDGGVPPFVELAELADQVEADAAAGAPDTTLTFKHPRENRLVRLGAVCGGPINAEDLDDMRKKAQARAGIEIAFVIDETASMDKYFKEVADFIDQNLAIEGDATNVKIAISWYSDWYGEGTPPRGKPNDPGPLTALVAEGIAAEDVAARRAAIVKKVREREHKKERIDPNDPTYAELVFQGLEAAIEKAGFTPGEHAMVFVIGDAGDRTEPEAALRKHYERVKDLILQHNLQLAFIQVGDPKDPDPSFIDQANALRATLPPGKQDSVVTQPLNREAKESLAVRIADIKAGMDAKRKTLLREIGRIESRNRYTGPGPMMEQMIKKNGLTVEQFDERKLQYFVPAYGWLYHPQQPDIEPQLRELVFMAKPEIDALMATLDTVAEQLETTGTFDADAAVKKLAKLVAERSTHSQARDAIERAWSEMPPEEKTFGRFLNEKLGLRVRNPILYHGGASKPNPATTQAAGKLRRARNQLANARKAAAWYDAWLVLP